jgi:hypothetical protein
MRFKRKLTLLFLVPCLFAFTAKGELPITRFQYLIDATNQITELLNRDVQPSADDLAKALANACNTLGVLFADKDFVLALDSQRPAAANSLSEREALKSDLSRFVSEFLVQEEQALLHAGLSPAATKRILASASLFHNAVDADPDPNVTWDTLKKLQNDICEAAQEMSKHMDNSRARAEAEKWSFRFGGIALIIVDVAVAAPTSGGAIASVAIGTAVAGWGIGNGG